jgi:hypothetical protein
LAPLPSSKPASSSPLKARSSFQGDEDAGFEFAGIARKLDFESLGDRTSIDFKNLTQFFWGKKIDWSCQCILGRIWTTVRARKCRPLRVPKKHRRVSTVGSTERNGVFFSAVVRTCQCSNTTHNTEE